MNKKGGAFLAIIAVIVIALLFTLVVYGITRINPVCNTLDLKWLDSYVNGKKLDGVVFNAANFVNTKALDPSFQYLFGSTFLGSVKWFSGYKTVCESVWSFVVFFWIALVAFVWILLGRFLLGLIVGIFNLGDFWNTAVGFSFGQNRTTTATRYAGFLFIFPALMQVTFVNRIIEILTLYHFVNWFVYTLILAIYVGWLPEIIQGLIKHHWTNKFQKTVYQIKTGEAKFRAAGGG